MIDVKALYEALESAFDMNQLRLMLFLNKYDLEKISGSTRLSDAIQDVIRHAQHRDTVEKLLANALAFRPTNERLTALAKAHKIEPTQYSLPQSSPTEQTPISRSSPSVIPTTTKHHQTWVVDDFHRGHFTTITEAINAAKDGDKIIVRPGLYDESLIIDKVLEITGEGKRNEIMLEARDGNVIEFKAKRGIVRNFTIRQRGIKKHSAVYITAGRLFLTQCDISCSMASGIEVHEENANPRLYDNLIYDCKDAGIFISSKAHGLVEKNVLFKNTFGIAVAGLADPIVRNNTVYNNHLYGVYVYGNGKGLFENNQLAGNKLEINEYCKPHVKLSDNKEYGSLIEMGMQRLRALWESMGLIIDVNVGIR